MGCPTGFEPATSWTTTRRSNRLSYGHHAESLARRDAIYAARPPKVKAGQSHSGPAGQLRPGANTAGFPLPGYRLPPLPPDAAGRRGTHPAFGEVMKCHVLSCDVMFRRVAPLSVRLAEAPLSVSCISFLLPVPFRLHRRRLACGASLFRAYRMGARARVCAGAVRAPDCAHASRAQGTLLPSVPLGVFRAGAR